MSSRGTRVLALALLVACCYAWLDLVADAPDASWRSVLFPQPPPPSEAVKRLLALDPQGVRAIRLQRDSVDVRVSRVGSGWDGVERPRVLDDFLASLGGLAEIMKIDVRHDELSDYGLDPAEAMIELLRHDRPPIVLLLGTRNPPATAVYLRLGHGGPVVLTGALILWDLDKALKAVLETAEP